jgi:hypothetical protein
MISGEDCAKARVDARKIATNTKINPHVIPGLTGNLPFTKQFKNDLFTVSLPLA